LSDGKDDVPASRSWLFAAVDLQCQLAGKLLVEDSTHPRRGLVIIEKGT
jgi:hypothetical protein